MVRDITPKVSVKTTYDFRTAEMLQAQFAQISSMTVEVGVMSSDPLTLMKAHVNEYGANIPVTVDMQRHIASLRTQFTGKDRSLRKRFFLNKRVIRIPSRSFLRSTYKEQTGRIKHKMAGYLKQIYLGKRTSIEVLGLIGEYLTEQVKQKFVDKNNGTWARNAEWTRVVKGRDDPLIDTGVLRNSIGYRLTGIPTAGQVKKFLKKGSTQLVGEFRRHYRSKGGPTGRPRGPHYKPKEAKQTSYQKWNDLKNSKFAELYNKSPQEAAQFERVFGAATGGPLFKVGKATITREQAAEVLQSRYGMSSKAPTEGRRGRPRKHPEGYKYKPVEYDRRKDPEVIQNRMAKIKAGAKKRAEENALIDEIMSAAMWKKSRTFKKGKK